MSASTIASSSPPRKMLQARPLSHGLTPSLERSCLSSCSVEAIEPSAINSVASPPLGSQLLQNAHFGRLADARKAEHDGAAAPEEVFRGQSFASIDALWACGSHYPPAPCPGIERSNHSLRAFNGRRRPAKKTRSTLKHTCRCSANRSADLTGLRDVTNFRKRSTIIGPVLASRWPLNAKSTSR